MYACESPLRYEASSMNTALEHVPFHLLLLGPAKGAR